MESPMARVFVANGEMHAQQIRAFLEAAGISSIERGETLRNTHGLTVDGLGAVGILVPEADAADAPALLDSAEVGAFRLGDAPRFHPMPSARCTVIVLAALVALARPVPAQSGRAVLDVVVFYDPSPVGDRYSSDVRREVMAFMQRMSGYRPRPRPAQLSPTMRMVYEARESYEAKLVAAAAAPGVEPLAQRYVDDLRPCYEWEGYHHCPEREARFAEEHLAVNPDTPFRHFLPLLAAHRWICAAQGYEYEEMPQDATRARRAAVAPLSTALKAQSLLIRTAAQELKARGRCFAAAR